MRNESVDDPEGEDNVKCVFDTGYLMMGSSGVEHYEVHEVYQVENTEHLLQQSWLGKNIE